MASVCPSILPFTVWWRHVEYLNTMSENVYISRFEGIDLKKILELNYFSLMSKLPEKMIRWTLIHDREQKKKFTEQ